MIQWKTGLRHQGIKKTKFARSLRQEMTDAERRFWRLLRNRALLNYKFRRQVPFGPYFLDFYCAEKNLAVELDGSQHCNSEGVLHDKKRDAFLAKQGLKILRYSNRDVFLNPSGIIDDIKIHLVTK